MNTIIYDSRRIFWPQNAPASAIPITLVSPTELSAVTNVQSAIQMLADDISSTIQILPNKLDPDNDSLRVTIERFNELIDALKHLKSDGK